MTSAIRAASRAGMELLVDWAAAEGWNPGLQDADAFHAADPEGFLLALEGDTPLACISAVRSGPGHGFIGFYIVRPDRRGEGLGLALWQAGMARLAGRIVGLDGVVAQQANYRRSGFALAWRNVRYAADRPRAVSAGQGSPVPARLEDALALDVFPTVRESFWRSWLGTPGHRALAVPGRGFGVIRPCRQGAKLGPIFARDDAAARALFNALIAGVEGPVFLDLPEPNAAAVALATEAGMTPSFETARMYAGGTPVLDTGRIYGIASFELG